MSVLSSSAAASGEISGEETAAVAANRSAACCNTPGNTVPPLSLSTHTQTQRLSETDGGGLEKDYLYQCQCNAFLPGAVCHFLETKTRGNIDGLVVIIC